MNLANTNSSPFDLNNDTAYQQWRQHKLDQYPDSIESLIVEVKDPKQLSKAEHEAMMQRISKTNMVIYAGPTGDDPDRDIPRQIGLQFGLRSLDNNTGADDEGVTSLEVKQDQWHKHYIPYTDRPIHWHTDGYYNSLSQQIHGLLLHCVRPAAQGGENALMDHEIAYIMLRDIDPVLIYALMHDHTMTIPENRTDEKVDRPERSGPVFMSAPDGSLHMRYTARKRNIIWQKNEVTQRAVNTLSEILDHDSPYIFRATLESGQGLICNNVLHDRSGFNDNDHAARLLYRLRYYDRIN
ncbi:MAG: taurine catabolism dioxygenase TauD [Gammaproteobacteria bacterium]|nr:MAG: taurine catabolism dioxygenase TauD [Gammaproteobacteria bacterium]